MLMLETIFVCDWMVEPGEESTAPPSCPPWSDEGAQRFSSDSGLGRKRLRSFMGKLHPVCGTRKTAAAGAQPERPGVAVGVRPCVAWRQGLTGRLMCRSGSGARPVHEFAATATARYGRINSSAWP